MEKIRVGSAGENTAEFLASVDILGFYCPRGVDPNTNGGWAGMCYNCRFSEAGYVHDCTWLPLAQQGITQP